MGGICIPCKEGDESSGGSRLHQLFSGEADDSGVSGGNRIGRGLFAEAGAQKGNPQEKLSFFPPRGAFYGVPARLSSGEIAASGRLAAVSKNIASENSTIRKYKKTGPISDWPVRGWKSEVA